MSTIDQADAHYEPVVTRFSVTSSQLGAQGFTRVETSGDHILVSEHEDPACSWDTCVMAEEGFGDNEIPYLPAMREMVRKGGGHCEFNDLDYQVLA